MTILRVGLAVLLALLPAVCRCHIGLHDHDDHVHVATAHGWTHVPVVRDRSEHTHNGHHHHGHESPHGHDRHHHHGHNDHAGHEPRPEAGPDHSHSHAASEHHHELFSMVLCDHGDHDCACPPLMSSLQKNDDLPRAPLVGFVPLEVLVRPIDLPALLARERIREQDHVPRPPSALLRQHCALIV